jgi:hypothetical protein
VNGKERVRVEQLSYFYNNNVTIRLPNQVKIRATATDYYWPSIEVGYESGGENEEAQGLDEPNGKSNLPIINKGKILILNYQSISVVCMRWNSQEKLPHYF